MHKNIKKHLKNDFNPNTLDCKEVSLDFNRAFSTALKNVEVNFSFNHTRVCPKVFPASYITVVYWKTL